MARVVFLTFISAFALYGYASAEQIFGRATVDGGKVGIGVISGGEFGPGSFSIGAPGQSKATAESGSPTVQNGVSYNEVPNAGDPSDALDSKPAEPNQGHIPQLGGGFTAGQNVRQRPERPLTESFGSPGQGGNVGGHGQGSLIVTGAIHNNKRKPDMAVAYGAVIDGQVVSSYPGNNAYVSRDGSIAIGVVSGGNFDNLMLSAKKQTKSNKPNKSTNIKGNSNCRECPDDQAGFNKGTRADNMGYNTQNQKDPGHENGVKEDMWVW